MPEDKSTLQRVRNFPWLSTATAVSPIALLSEATISYVAPLIFVSPILSAGLAIPGGLNLFDKTRSGLSKVFSAAAIGVGVAGPVMLLSTSGSEALGAFFYTTFSMAAAGGLNVVSHLTRNVGIGLSIKISREKKDDAPKGP